MKKNAYAGAWAQLEDGDQALGTGVQRLVDAWFEMDAARWHDLYARSDLSGAIYQERYQRALAWVDDLGLAAGSRVLEVGCGAGLMAAALARRGLEVQATDPALTMLEMTRRQAAESGVRLNLAQTDAQQFAFTGHVADLVVALGVIPWLHAPQAALSEASRVLAPGGYLVVSADNRARLAHTFDPRSSPYLLSTRRAARQLLGRAPSSGIRSKLHWPREFDALLASVGLDKLRAATVGFGPFTLFGHVLLPDRFGLRLHRQLQRLADSGAPGLRLAGNHYLVLARKRA